MEKLSKVVTRICDPDKVKYVFERGAFSMLLLCAFRFIPKGLEIPIFFGKAGQGWHKSVLEKNSYYDEYNFERVAK